MINRIIRIVICLTKSFLEVNQCSAHVFYKTTVTVASIIFGTSVGLFCEAKLIEDARGPITISDLDLLDFNTINGFGRGPLITFRQVQAKEEKMPKRY